MADYTKSSVLSDEDLWERSSRPGNLKAADLGIDYGKMQDGLEVLTEGYMFNRTDN